MLTERQKLAVGRLSEAKRRGVDFVYEGFWACIRDEDRAIVAGLYLAEHPPEPDPLDEAEQMCKETIARMPGCAWAKVSLLLIEHLRGPKP